MQEGNAVQANIESVGVESVPAKRKLVDRFLDRYWRARDNESKMGPIPRTMFAVSLALGGFAVAEGLQWVKSKVVGPDEFLVKIKQEQESSFSELKASLARLNQSIDGGSRDAFSQVKNATDEIKRLNSDLVTRLTLATAENERLARVAGVPGGLQMIFSNNTGMPLDDSSEIGVQRIGSSGADVSLTTREGTQSQFLRSGESISYVGNSGAQCRVTLLSVDSHKAVSATKRCG